MKPVACAHGALRCETCQWCAGFPAWLHHALPPPLDPKKETMTPTPLGTLDHCLDQLSYPLTPEERERYIEDARRALRRLKRMLDEMSRKGAA